MGEGSTVHREAFRGYAACMSLQAGPGGWELVPTQGGALFLRGIPPPTLGSRLGEVRGGMAKPGLTEQSRGPSSGL